MSVRHVKALPEARSAGSLLQAVVLPCRRRAAPPLGLMWPLPGGLDSACKRAPGLVATPSLVPNASSGRAGTCCICAPLSPPRVPALPHTSVKSQDATAMHQAVWRACLCLLAAAAAAAAQAPSPAPAPAPFPQWLDGQFTVCVAESGGQPLAACAVGNSSVASFHGARRRHTAVLAVGGGWGTMKRGKQACPPPPPQPAARCLPGLPQGTRWRCGGCWRRSWTPRASRTALAATPSSERAGSGQISACFLEHWLAASPLGCHSPAALLLRRRLRSQVHAV